MYSMNELHNLEEAIKYKIRSAHHHKIASEKSYTNTTSNYDKLFISGVEFTAMMTTLHSSLDILAQWLNLKYKLNYKSSKVTFNKIIEKITDLKVQNELVKLKNTATYLNDFCNYIKHRNIVKVAQVSYFLSPAQPASFHDIESFKKNKHSYPSKKLSVEREKQFNNIYYALTTITDIHIPLIAYDN